MQLIIDGNIYKMTNKQEKSVLGIASRMIKKGIYAVEKGGVCELKKEKYCTAEDLQRAVAEYKEKGFEVHYNA